jgi:hypothetical protein
MQLLVVHKGKVIILQKTPLTAVVVTSIMLSVYLQHTSFSSQMLRLENIYEVKVDFFKHQRDTILLETRRW